MSCHKTMIAVDESTTIKNPTAKRTKSILQLRKVTLNIEEFLQVLL